jgi:hypothetical protein
VRRYTRVPRETTPVRRARWLSGFRAADGISSTAIIPLPVAPR